MLLTNDSKDQMIAEREHKTLRTREVSPPSHRGWLQEREDEYAALERCYSEWNSDVTKIEELLLKHVHNNDNLNDADLRQHRFQLCRLMFSGEQLAFGFLCLDGDNDVKSYVNLIDGKVIALRKEFIEWHTPSGYQDPVPESFKSGMKEAEEGKLLEFPDAKV